jgi:hypothetical protein
MLSVLQHPASCSLRVPSSIEAEEALTSMTLRIQLLVLRVPQMRSPFDLPDSLECS